MLPDDKPLPPPPPRAKSAIFEDEEKSKVGSVSFYEEALTTSHSFTKRRTWILFMPL